MGYNDYTLRSKSLIKRFTHQTRYGIGLELSLKNNPATLLDYGTGSAHLLLEIHAKKPAIELYGFEPDDDMIAEARQDCRCVEKIHLFQNVNDLLDKQFDKVTCFEVFEHLNEEDSLIALTNIKKLLKSKGDCIISIPIETGFASLCKNMVRLVIGVPHDKSWKNIFWAFLGKKIERHAEGRYLPSHVGFRHTDLEKYFAKAGFKISSKRYSPVPVLRGFINSQIFYQLKP